MAGILSQEEVDALLKGLDSGEIEQAEEKPLEAAAALPCDLINQTRIIRGKMPTLDMTSEKFARLLRANLSALLKRMVGVASLPSSLIKFSEYLKTVPVPTSLHVFKMEPLRGSALIVIDSRLIFAIVDIVFGGEGKSTYRIEGREYTAIENNLIKKVVSGALVELEKAWQGVMEIKTSYLRAETNPQFASIVAPNDLVVITKFEVDIENVIENITICIPYATLEPLRVKLQAGYQSEQLDMDREWVTRLEEGLKLAEAEIVAKLGQTEISGHDLINLKRGDVILLDRYFSDPIEAMVEGVPKFKGKPGVFKGNLAFLITELLTGKEVESYGS